MRKMLPTLTLRLTLDCAISILGNIASLPRSIHLSISLTYFRSIFPLSISLSISLFYGSYLSKEKSCREKSVAFFFFFGGGGGGGQFIPLDNECPCLSLVIVLELCDRIINTSVVPSML